IWVLSRNFLVITTVDTPELRWGEIEWAEQRSHEGVLARVSDYRKNLGGLPGGDQDWLIDEDVHVAFTQHTGYHAYFPLEGRERKIWVQVPLEEVSKCRSSVGDEVTGVWLTAGQNAFVPDAGGKPGETALLLWGERTRDEYVWGKPKERPCWLLLILGGA